MCPTAYLISTCGCSIGISNSVFCEQNNGFCSPLFLHSLCPHFFYSDSVAFITQPITQAQNIHIGKSGKRRDHLLFLPFLHLLYWIHYLVVFITYYYLTFSNLLTSLPPLSVSFRRGEFGACFAPCQKNTGYTVDRCPKYLLSESLKVKSFASS